MKATGIVRQVDSLGRLVLPKELRRTFGIHEGDPMEFFVEGNGIFVKKFDLAANMEQLLDSLEGTIKAKEALVLPAQLQALLAKVEEMKAIINPDKN